MYQISANLVQIELRNATCVHCQPLNLEPLSGSLVITSNKNPGSHLPKSLRRGRCDKNDVWSSHFPPLNSPSLMIDSLFQVVDLVARISWKLIRTPTQARNLMLATSAITARPKNTTWIPTNSQSIKIFRQRATTVSYAGKASVLRVEWGSTKK